MEPKLLTIEEMREWLRDQRQERIPDGGIRKIASDVGVHENVLYRIIKGGNPGYRTAAKLREYLNARQH